MLKTKTFWIGFLVGGLTNFVFWGIILIGCESLRRCF